MELSCACDVMRVLACRSKFGASFDVRLVRRGYQMYLHVMWRYLEQQVSGQAPYFRVSVVMGPCCVISLHACVHRRASLSPPTST